MSIDVSFLRPCPQSRSYSVPPSQFRVRIRIRHRAMEQGRHQTSWYPFVAHAELVVEDSNVCLTTRVSKLSRQSSDLQLRDTFAAGTSVVVKVYAGPHFFQARGTFCDSEHGNGD